MAKFLGALLFQGATLLKVSASLHCRSNRYLCVVGPSLMYHSYLAGLLQVLIPNAGITCWSAPGTAWELLVYDIRLAPRSKWNPK